MNAHRTTNQNISMVTCAIRNVKVGVKHQSITHYFIVFENYILYFSKFANLI